MAQLNPILVRLQKKIEDYNKDVQRKIDDVAYRQKIVAVGIVCFDLVVLFLSNYLLPDDSKDESLRLLSLFSNDQLSILITVISIGFSLSTASLIGRNSFKELKIDETIIEPKLQYAGEWEYLTEFRIQTKDDGSTEYQRFKGSVRKACCVDGVCPKEIDRKLHNMLIFYTLVILCFAYSLFRLIYWGFIYYHSKRHCAYRDSTPQDMNSTSYS